MRFFDLELFNEINDESTRPDVLEAAKDKLKNNTAAYKNYLYTIKHLLPFNTEALLGLDFTQMDLIGRTTMSTGLSTNKEIVALFDPAGAKEGRYVKLEYKVLRGATLIDWTSDDEYGAASNLKGEAHLYHDPFSVLHTVCDELVLEDGALVHKIVVDNGKILVIPFLDVLVSFS
jgi:hypothetical protein